jgi:hypothetical protein
MKKVMSSRSDPATQVRSINSEFDSLVYSYDDSLETDIEVINAVLEKELPPDPLLGEEYETN